MAAWRSNDLPAHFAPGAMAAAARWAVRGDADATPGSNGGSDTPPGAPDRPGSTTLMAMIGAVLVIDDGIYTGIRAHPESRRKWLYTVVTRASKALIIRQE
jgi:hypothetical protein